MHYVLSDIHGCYDRYKKMLKKINFSQNDTLYILGDVIDWGPKPISIILDIINRPNVKMIKGNHEAMLLNFKNLIIPDSQDDVGYSFGPKMLDFISWIKVGGQSTIDEIQSLDRNTIEKVFSFIQDLSSYEEISIDSSIYIMVHAGLSNFSPDRPLSSYCDDELLWKSPDYSTPYFTDNRFVIAGHTPTIFMEGIENKGSMFIKNNHIAIDCGCGYSTGKLGCMRLEDKKEFYVE